MKDNAQTRILVIAGIVILVTLLVVGLLFGRTQKTSTTPTEANQTDLAGAVIIDNTDQLNSILLPEQYAATQNALSDYIHNHIDRGIDHATISSGPDVAADGTVSFKVTTDNPTKTFSVQINRKAFDSITITIPETNFTQTIQVYGTNQ